MSSFSIYEGADQQWYWRLVATNGEIIATGEGYKTEQSARRGVNAVKRAVLNDVVSDLKSGADDESPAKT